jgi:hypothetical protein
MFDCGWSFLLDALKHDIAVIEKREMAEDIYGYTRRLKVEHTKEDWEFLTILYRVHIYVSIIMYKYSIWIDIITINIALA